MAEASSNVNLSSMAFQYLEEIPTSCPTRPNASFYAVWTTTSNSRKSFKIRAIFLLFDRVIERAVEKAMYSSEAYPLKRWGRVTTRPRRLVIEASTAATSIETAAVAELLLIERTDLFKRPLSSSGTFIRGFTVLLRGFIDILKGRLIRDFTVVMILITTATFFCDFCVFLRSNVVVILFCLFCSF